MALDFDGRRPRFFHERAIVEAQQGNPLRDDVSKEARERLVREINHKAWWKPPGHMTQSNFRTAIWSEVKLVLGEGAWEVNPEGTANRVPCALFLSALEVAAAEFFARRRVISDIELFQSILADDLSSYRFVDVDPKGVRDRFQIQHIDNPHLHREIVDRTFELTQRADFKAAQASYAEAWKLYSKGDLDDAVVNAHKAVESTAKVVVKRLDPSFTPDQMQMNQLVPELVRLNVLPARLTNMVEHLRHIVLSAGSLRNSAGIGHGSLDLTTAEANIALLALRISGSIVSFLIQRWEKETRP